MKIEIDGDVAATIEFMQSRVPAARIVSVAEGLAKIAPVLWGRYKAEEISVLLIGNDQLTDSVTSPPIAIESGLGPGCADGDFVVAKDAGAQT